MEIIKISQEEKIIINKAISKYIINHPTDAEAITRKKLLLFLLKDYVKDYQG